MSSYAEGTGVPVDRSKAEIERTLGKYGAEQFAYGTSAEASFIAFRAHGRVIRFVVPMPKAEETVVKRVRYGESKNEARQKKMEREIRRRWRALCLCVKAKLEAVASGIASFEVEFMPYTVLKDGRTVADALGPAVEKALETRTMPMLALTGPVEGDPR